jgi:hypothetical protein
MQSLCRTLLVACCFLLLGMESAHALCVKDPVTGTRHSITNAPCDIEPVDPDEKLSPPATCPQPTAGSIYELQGDASRCGTARATPFSTAACPGNSTSDLIVGNFSDDPTYTECVQIDNTSNKAYFIPLKTLREWNAFKAAAQSNRNLNLALRACSCMPGRDDKAACGTANTVPITSAPTDGLCNYGKASVVNNNGTDWVWSCTKSAGNNITTANCSAPIATAPIQAGCYVDTMAWDYVTPGECDGTEQNPSKSYYGTNLTMTNTITWSVGDTTNSGNDAYNFSDRSRYSVTWRGDCTGNSDWCMRENVPNGRYSASVEVFDQVTRSVVHSSTVIAHKRVKSCRPGWLPSPTGCCKNGMCKHPD